MSRKLKLLGAFPSKAGPSAYEIAQQNGFEGTEAEWLKSLVGPKGENGYTPIKGVNYFTETDKVEVFTSTTLTDEEKTQARQNIGAATEEQTITTNPAYSHKNLPDGEKTITIIKDVNEVDLGNTAILSDFATDLTPKGGFQRTSGYNGLTFSKEGGRYKISGTPSQITTLNLKHEDGSTSIPVSSEMIGETYLFCCFPIFRNSSSCLITMRCYDADGNKLDYISVPYGSSTVKTIRIPETAATYSVYCYIESSAVGSEIDVEFELCILKEGSYKLVTLENNIGTEVLTSTEFSTMPYKSRVSWTTPIRDLIDENARKSEEEFEKLKDLIDSMPTTYLTPESFGAVGDGVADDSDAIIECLTMAANTKQTVIMAKQYKISEPIQIDSRGTNYIGLNIYINKIEYTGTDAAVIIQGRSNTIKINKILSSDGTGIKFAGSEVTYDKATSHNDLEVNTILAGKHGIIFETYENGSPIYQNIVRFNYIRAGGPTDTIDKISENIEEFENPYDGQYVYVEKINKVYVRSGEEWIDTGRTSPIIDKYYGIASFYLGGEEVYNNENTFYGGQISHCEYAVYDIKGNSRCYNIEVEGNVKGGFYINGNVTIFHPRHAESQRDGELPFFKFKSARNVTIYLSCTIYLGEIDLSEAVDTYVNNNDSIERPSTETSHLGVIYGPIGFTSPKVSQEVSMSPAISTKTYLWGKHIIMTPHMAYRKEVTTEIFDTRDIDDKDSEGKQDTYFTQLPTKFVVNTVNTDIYLHPSYCAFGFNEFEVEQANGCTCKVYSCATERQQNADGGFDEVEVENLIFDGTEQGDGLYRFNVYKDATYCAEHTTGLLRRDFSGHKWQVLKLGGTVIYN